ncbi:uncharacterized protein LOC122717661 [Apis laboriosa]|uniref:uncharacterized protein LOC122717661 n=1 Tax=Apis laboriosa TaxID=183418 RepID=UPI001CC54149|nr:uncharacterized protein LOC122717661 [Apis laboriosa]
MDQFPKNFRPFHPKDPPSGTLNYDLGALSKHQKSSLNSRKTIEIRRNEMYLKNHPEIKGLISILLRNVLRKHCSTNVHEIIGEFFNRPRHQIVLDLLRYFLSTEQESIDKNVFQGLTNVQVDEKKISCCNV